MGSGEARGEGERGERGSAGSEGARGAWERRGAGSGEPGSAGAWGVGEREEPGSAGAWGAGERGERGERRGAARTLCTTSRQCSACRLTGAAGVSDSSADAAADGSVPTTRARHAPSRSTSPAVNLNT